MIILGKGVRKKKSGGGLSLIILIIVVLVVFKFKYVAEKTIDFFDFNKEAIEKINEVKLQDVVDLNMYDSDGKNLYIANGSKLEKYDSQGNVLWYKEMKNNNVLIKSMNEDVFLVDKNQGDIFKIDDKGKIISSKYSLGNIENIRINEESYCSYISKDKKKISILNRDLEPVVEVNITSGDVLDYDLSRENNILVVSVLDMNESSVITKVIVYNLDGKMVGAFNYANRILYKINIKADKIVALGDDIIFSFTINDGDLWENKITEDLIAQEFLPSGDVNIFVREEQSDLVESKEVKSLLSYGIDGKEKYRVEVVEDILGLESFSGKTIGIVEKGIVLFDEKGNIAAKKDTSEKIEDLKWISKDSFALRNGNNLVFYKIN